MLEINNDVYLGDFLNNKKCGKGKMTYFNGDIYEGDWNNDCYEGYGEIKYSNGDYYKGKLCKMNPFSLRKFSFSISGVNK